MMAEKTIRVRVDSTGASKNLKQVQTDLKGASTQAANLNANIKNARGGMGQFNTVMQQAGYQVGDFFVQIQSGQSALTAFSQQGSQLAGVFGPQGAVIGALISIGAVLTGVFTRSSETAKKSVDELIDSFDELGNSQRELLKLKLSDAIADIGPKANEAWARVSVLNDKLMVQQEILRKLNAGEEVSGWLSGILNSADTTREKIEQITRELTEARAEQEEYNDKLQKYRDALDGIKSGELEHQEAIENTKKLYDRMVDSYDLQISAMGKTEREQAKLVASHELGSQATDNQIDKINQLIDKYFDEKDALEASQEAEKNAIKQHDEEVKARERQITALSNWYQKVQDYNLSASELNDQWRDDELTKLDAYHEAGKISQEEYEEARYQIAQKWLTKSEKLNEKSSKTKQKQTRDDIKDTQTAIAAGQTALEALYDATESRSDSMNALVKGAAVFQATANMWLAASQALALPADVTLAQKFASYAAVVTAGAGIISSINNLSPSRQVGGYMNANTPYQVGGGSHTSDPEMYTSGGKSYLVDSSAGTMTRLSGNQGGQSSATGAVQFQINNNGQAADVTQTSNTLDENGVRQIVLELTPQIMSSEAGNSNSAFRTTMSSVSRTKWNYS